MCEITHAGKISFWAASIPLGILSMELWYLFVKPASIKRHRVRLINKIVDNFRGVKDARSKNIP